MQVMCVEMSPTSNVVFASVDELLAPDLRVAGTAALEQGHDGGAFETPRDVARMQALAHELRELRQDFFGPDDADLVTEFTELVRTDVDEAMGSGAGLRFSRLVTRSRN